MNKLIDAMRTNDSTTYNGAITHSTSSNACLDLFFLAGACRNEKECSIVSKLSAAYEEDRVKCLKIIFWAGDIREGAGERRFFKIALNWLLQDHVEDLIKYMNKVPEYSRWDVLFELDHPMVLEYICNNLTYKEDSKPDALLCKWLPRKGQYKGLAKKIQKYTGLTPKQYRKFIVEHTKVVEQQMCAKKWNEIEYEHVPSVAINKYNKAWYRNDEDRFIKYLEKVRDGKSKINASVIYPHDIIRGAKVGSHYDDTTYKLNEAQITQWENLPNYLEGKPNSIIPVCDVSGSMECPNGLPISISLALGLYISERNEGIFKDAFITFSDRPTMQYLKGDINQRLKQLYKSNWGMTTNLTKVFDEILKRATNFHISPEEMPETILVISDMEFNECGDMTNFEYIRNAYNAMNYKLPQIVFWNVNGRVGNVPIKMNQEGVALVSGASPQIIKAILSNEVNPLNMMNSIVERDRYSFIM